MSDKEDFQSTEDSEKTVKEKNTKNALAFISDPLDLSQFAQDKLLKMHESEIVTSIDKVKKEIAQIEQELGGTLPQQGTN
jgi:hypothetical protein